MKKIIVFTNKDINNLLRDNGHDYRLIKLLEYDHNNIVCLVNIDQPIFFSSENYFIIDIPGLSFIKYYKLLKSLGIHHKNLFMQDSFFRYSVNKFLVYVKNRYGLKEIFKSLYHIFYAFLNELFISVYFKKIGYVSTDDFFLPIFFKRKYFVVKNGVDSFNSINKQKNINRKRIKLFFWGNIMYAPNKDSLIIFVRNYWNDLQKKFSNIELHIYGKYDSDLLDELENCNANNIFLEGRFDTHESLFENNDIFINFIQYGAGIKNKTLEALAYGVPMICTKHSLEGIDEMDKYKYIYSNINELIQTIELIIEKYDTENAKRSSKIINDTYTWKNAYLKYIQEIKR